MRFYSKHDSILLIEDAVYYALTPTFYNFFNASEFKTTPTIYALKEDIEARGITAHAHNDIKLVTYEGFVELTATHDKSSSWY